MRVPAKELKISIITTKRAYENLERDGFIGQNGAGKTTTIRLMLDVIKADSGEIKLFGEDVFAYLKRFSLPSKKKCGDFSRGMRMKLQIAVAKLYPELVIDRANLEEIMLFYVASARS